MISPVFFQFFKILIFQVVKRLKEQKMPQNAENFCLSHLIFQGPYIIWSSFIIHIMYKRIISPAIFFQFFQNLKFRIKGQKMAQNDKNFLSVSQELYIIWLRYLVHMCKMMISPANFFIFKILIFGIFRGQQAKNDL